MFFFYYYTLTIIKYPIRHILNNERAVIHFGIVFLMDEKIYLIKVLPELALEFFF